MIFILIFITIILILLFYKRTVPQLDKKRKLLLAILRSISIITILVLLLNPIIYFLKHKIIKPEIIILKDISLSMEQTSQNKSKIEVLEIFREKLEKELSTKNYKITYYEFAEGLNGSKSSTNISRTLEDISNRHMLTNIHGIYLFSDGWFNDEDLTFIEDLNIPISFFAPNFEISDFDLEISNITFNKTTYRGEITPIIADVYANNFSGKAKLNFCINKKIEQTKEIDFSSDNFQQVFFENIFQITGLIPFEMVIESDSTNEINLANNRCIDAIQVLNERSKILVISDKLNWDTKFIMDSIKKNPRFNSIFLLKDDFLKSGRKKVQLEEQINDTVTLIFVNSGSLKFSSNEITIIKNFIENGGGLLLQGKPIFSMEDVLPVTYSNVSSVFESILFFTRESKQFETFNLTNTASKENIPPVRYYYISPKLQSKILAKFENEEQSPAILYCEYERGKILYFAFNNFWKWQLWDSENSYSELILNICQWLSQQSSDRFIAFTNKNSYFTNEKIKIRLNAYDEKLTPIPDLNAKLIINNETGKIIFEEYLLSMEDEYYIEVKPLDPGKYLFTISDDKFNQQTEGTFIVTADNLENRDRGFNIPLLSYIVNQTGGTIYDESSLKDLSFTKAIQKIEDLKKELPIYRKWYIIALFLICFCLELYLRKRWGLL